MMKSTGRQPTCHLVVVYENDISEAVWVPDIEHKFVGFSKTLHTIGFKPLQLKEGGFRWLQSNNISNSSTSNSGRPRSGNVNSTNAMIGSTQGTPTTYSKDILASASSILISDVLTKEELGIDYQRIRYPPVIFVGIGFGALVVMDTILRTKNSIPMGAVMTSVTRDGATARSDEFKRWYAGLKQGGGNGDMKMLTQLLDDFNRHCHREHIRLSCISRDINEEHEFIAQHLRYAHHSREKEPKIGKRRDGRAEIRAASRAALTRLYSQSKQKLLKSHIERSWPEVLLQLVVQAGDGENVKDLAVAGDPTLVDDPVLDIIKVHLGEHAHEPTIARVLQEASRRHKIGVVRRLLDDNVHPDSRVTRHEPTAFHLARSGKGRDSYGSNGASIDAEQTQLELFLRGAKANVLNGSYPWTFWRGFDSAAKALGNSLKQPDFIKVDVPEGESLRALVVDIYSRSSVNALPSEEHTENKTGCLSEKDQEGQRQRYEEPDGAGGWAYESDPTQVSSANDNSFAEVELQPETGSDTGRETKETGKKQSKSHDKHEFHQIAFPTIEELIHTKGPRAILNPTLPDFPSGLKAEDYTKFRWIHLPMNHMTWIRDLVEMICNEDCPEHYHLQSKPYGGDPGKTERLRRGSLTTCNDLCSTKHGRKSRFPCIPGYADSIFEARYWLGQQDTPGTEEYSTIRCLRPQFRRLGLVDSKRTGFALVLPYVHFERHDKVQRLKKLATRLERRKRWQSGSYCIRSIQKYHAKGDTEETHSSDGGSSSDEWDSSSESESDKDLDTSNGPASFSGRSGTSSSRATAGSSKSTMDIIKDDTYNTLPVHYRRTLSQFYYHSRLQRSRQVITRYFKRTWPHHHPLTLMVDQLWMLVLVDGTIITAFPSQMDGHSQEFPYFYTDLVQELLLDLRSQWRPPIETVLDLGFMVIQKSIGFLFNQRARYNKAFRFLNIYEQQLSEIAADEATWFHDLSAEVKQLPGPDDPRYELHAQRCLKNLLSLDAKTGVMRKMKRLKHIRRELSILFEIVRVQDTVLAQMTNALESREFRPEGVEGTNQDAFKSTAGLKDRRNRRVKKLESRKAALEILDQKAQGVMNELELFINRKEQYVQNLQSYFSGRLTQQSTRLANIVLILTVLTSVFAPLSFLSAFMALGITEMPRKDGDVSMPLWFASAVIFGIGLIIIAIILCITFWDQVKRIVRRALMTGSDKETPPLRGTLHSQDNSKGNNYEASGSQREEEAGEGGRVMLVPNRDDDSRGRTRTTQKKEELITTTRVRSLS